MAITTESLDVVIWTMVQKQATNMQLLCVKYFVSSYKYDNNVKHPGYIQ